MLSLPSSTSAFELPLGCRYGPSHCPSERNIREPDYHGAASHEPSHARVPHSREAQEPVERVHPGTQNREHETQDGVEKRQLVAVHLPNGFFAQTNGYELALLYAVLGFVLAILGPGMYSLDGLLRLSGVWDASVAWFMAGGAVVVGLANVALRRAVTRPVATAQR